MEASMESCEAIWIRKMLLSLFDQQLEPTMIYYENQSCMKLTENLVFHNQSKHIEIRYHFMWDHV